MIIVDRALARREEEGCPIRVGLIGTGFQGTGIIRQIVRATPGMRVVAVANRHLATAIESLTDLGIDPVVCDGTPAIDRAIASGRIAVTRDGEAVAVADGVDVVVECTGSIEYAAGLVLAAIDAGKHIVQMNAALDGTIGPILHQRAQAAGVTYSACDGGRPGVQMNLLRFVRGIGVTPVLCGSIAERRPPSGASLADAIRMACEQAVVANGTGFRVARRGMIGMDFSDGDPQAPPVPLEAAMPDLTRLLEQHGPGLVDYVAGCTPEPGVFVIGTHGDPRQRRFLAQYRLGPGPYYLFQAPCHLRHFEVPNSVARVALFGDTVLAPTAGPRVGVAAVAGRDLHPGETIGAADSAEIGGVAENHDVIERDRLLPLGIATGATTTRFVPKGQVLAYSDVRLPPGRVVDALYAQQSRRFGHSSIAA